MTKTRETWLRNNRLGLVRFLRHDLQSQSIGTNGCLTVLIEAANIQQTRARLFNLIKPIQVYRHWQIDARWPRGILCLASRECWSVICTIFVQPLKSKHEAPTNRADDALPRGRSV
jgi:hypothetical protein